MSTLRGFYRELWQGAADAISARLVDLSPSFWQIDAGARRTVINNYIVQIDDPVTLNIAGDKPLCHLLLSSEGLPVPPHEVYSLEDFGKAQQFMRRYPEALFVVKPAVGTSGARGVTTHVRTLKECRRASALASLYGDRILIESWIAGESYRLLFLDGELIHASRRQGWRVNANGDASIANLISTDSRLSLAQMPDVIRREIIATLKAQGLTCSSVPPAGTSILLHSTRKPLARTVEMRTVFDQQATAEIGPELRDQAARAVRAIGSKFAGVDLITTNPTVSLEEAAGAINEINTTPGLHHHYGLDGVHDGVPPAIRVLARLLDGNAPPETPLASVATENLPTERHRH